MKKFVIALLALGMFSAFAAEITVLDSAIPGLSTYDAMVSSRFQMDRASGAGSVIVTVTENRWQDMGGSYDQWGHYYPRRVNMPVVVFNESVKVEGLALQADQVIYAGRDGDVNCGRLGESSVLHLPTIFLTGKCKLSGHVSGSWSNSRVNVILTTK